MSRSGDGSPVYFHVDLDAFYASVEQVDNPTLAGKPVIVGATPGHRGVVSACSYEARAFGVHSAMPVSEAIRRCPNGIYLPVRMARYQELSSRVMAILGRFTPALQQISVDEAFLDMSGTRRLFGDAVETARRLKREVKSETGLNISIGIAPSRYLAKLASAFSKPDGLHRILPEEREDFVAALPMDKMWGIGQKTRSRLEAFGITTVLELRRTPSARLRGIVGPAGAAYLERVSRGQDPGIYSDAPRSHSASSETTFPRDVEDAYVIEGALLEISHEVMFRLLSREMSGKTVTLKLRLSDFRTLHAQRSLSRQIVSGDELYELARQLLHSRWDGKEAVRLVGVGIAGVDRKESAQEELFESAADRQQRVEQAVLGITRKLKGTRITKARLLGKDRKKRE